MHNACLAPSPAWVGPHRPPPRDCALPTGAQETEAPGPWVFLPIQMVTVWTPHGDLRVGLWGHLERGPQVCTLTDLVIQTGPRALPALTHRCVHGQSQVSATPLPSTQTHDHTHRHTETYTYTSHPHTHTRHTAA